MRATFFRLVAVALVLGAAANLALAQAVRPAGRDWNGFYTLPSNRELAAFGLKQDAPGEQLNGLITPHLQPWAKARMAATDGIADDTGQVCLPDGIFRYPSMGGRFVWLEERGRILMAFQNINTAGVRRIHLDRGHPKDPIPTYNGDSVGRWEGDTLLVDTVGFNDKTWLFGGMQPHTEEAHMMERMSRAGNGAYLHINITVDDKYALSSSYTYNRYYKLESTEMPEDVCNEDPDTWKLFRNEALKRQAAERAKQAK